MTTGTSTTTKVELQTMEGGEGLRMELVEFLTENSLHASQILRDGDKVIVTGDKDSVVEILSLTHSEAWCNIVVSKRLKSIEKMVAESSDDKGARIYKLAVLTWLDASKYGALRETLKAYKKAIKGIQVYGSWLSVTPTSKAMGAQEAVIKTLTHRAVNTAVDVKMREIITVD